VTLDDRAIGELLIVRDELRRAPVPTSCSTRGTTRSMPAARQWPRCAA
jgi:hypothetical protein